MPDYANPDFDRRLASSDKARLRGLKEVDCADCGIQYPPEIMCFHHVVPAQKSFTLSTAIGVRSWGEIRLELRKCVVLCTNCHGLRHLAMRNA